LPESRRRGGGDKISGKKTRGKIVIDIAGE